MASLQAVGRGSEQLCCHVILWVLDRNDVSNHVPNISTYCSCYYNKSTTFPSSLSRTYKTKTHFTAAQCHTGSGSPVQASLQAQPGGHQSRCYFSSPHHPGPLRCAAPGNHSAREPQSRTPHAQLSSARPPPPVLPRPPSAPSPAPRRAAPDAWRAGVHRAAAGTALGLSLIRDPP